MYHEETLSWCCPFCSQYVTITERHNISRSHHVIEVKSSSNPGYGIIIESIYCPNPECQKYSIKAYLCPQTSSNQLLLDIEGAEITWNLIPSSNAKKYPSYIPKPLIEDYEEAYLILNLSPKASATLSRRCLQGIIRDFFKVNEKTLFKEIESIKPLIDESLWDAIDGLRSIGNIGAHMQDDVNKIIEITPNEATIVLKLIEILLEETYIRKHEKDAKIAAIKNIAEIKKSEKTS